MPVYDYVATNAQGAQRRGQMPALDKNDLLATLKKDGLFLVSCHESKEVLEGLDAYVDQAQNAPAADPAGSAAPLPEQSRSPIQSPSQLGWMVIIFFICVYVGYLMGR